MMNVLPELSADIAGSDTELSQLYNPQPDVVGERPAVDEDSPELVDSALALEGIPREEGRHGRQGGVGGEGLHCAGHITPGTP